MTTPRIVVANGTVAVTRRTAFRKLLWTPSDPLVHEGYLYALASAQEKYGFALHHGQLVPTHIHLTLTPREANASEILRHVHRESARFVQEWLLENGYDAPATVWDDRPTHWMRVVGAGAQLRWSLYSHLNCVAAGLVERVEDYPGFASDLGLMKGGVIAVKRPPLYYAKDRAREVELRFEAPRSLLAAFDGDASAMVYRMRKLATELEDKYRDERRATGRTVMGADVVRRVHPWAEPRTPRERRGQRTPAFMLGGYDDDPDARRVIVRQCVEERRTFLCDHRGGLDAWRNGDRDVIFPAGTNKMRVLHGVRVAEPREGAILCAPDPEHATSRMDPAEPIRGVVDDVREAGEQDLDELRTLTCENDAPAPTDAGSPPDPASPSATDDRPERPPARGTRLTSPASTADEDHPSRLVTMRNRRDRGPP